MSFSDLYERDAKNQLRVWSIKVEDKKTHSEIIICHGIDGGKKIEKITKILKGKNIGKTNETTHYSQAVADAKSKWEHKQTQGYSTDKFNNENKSRFPMLAKEYEKNKKKIIFPCYAQPKIDGVRCVYSSGELYSRLGKVFFGMEHIKNELSCFGNSIVDGELYSYEMNFNKLVGLVKSETLSNLQKEESRKVLFIVYDKISSLDYSQRLSEIKAVIKSNQFKYINLIETVDIHSDEEVYKFHNKFVEEGYEGIMIRNKKGKYEEKKRSSDLLKYKSFVDNEFKITGFFSEKVIENGIEKDLVIWECETQTGDKFTVRPRGTIEEREEMYKKAKSFIGCMLTVKYQELTPEGIPRFPSATGLTIRNYE